MRVEAEIASDRGRLFRMNTGRVFEVITEFGWVVCPMSGAPVDHPEVDGVMHAVVLWRESHPKP